MLVKIIPQEIIMTVQMSRLWRSGSRFISTKKQIIIKKISIGGCPVVLAYGGSGGSKSIDRTPKKIIRFLLLKKCLHPTRPVSNLNVPWTPYPPQPPTLSPTLPNSESQSSSNPGQPENASTYRTLSFQITSTQKLQNL